MFTSQTISNTAKFFPVTHIAGTKNDIVRSKSTPSHTILVRRSGVASITKVISNISHLESEDHHVTILLTALELQARLRSRWPAVMARAREMQKVVPDPVQSIVDLLGNLPGDYATWREIVEEPYG